MLANGSAAPAEMAAAAAMNRQAAAATRSQDDATVAYFFQRPQTDPDFQNFKHGGRWAVGDDSVLEVSFFVYCVSVEATGALEAMLSATRCN